MMSNKENVHAVPNRQQVKSQWPQFNSKADSMGKPKFQQQTNNPLIQILAAARSPDQKIREPAEKKLKELENQNLQQYLFFLCSALANEKDGVNHDIRQLAGLCLKNAITAKSEQQQKRFQERWIMLQEQMRVQIRNMLLNLLGSQAKSIRSTAALVIAKIAASEIPRGYWKGAVNQLVALMKSPERIEACFYTLGYICDECAPYLKGTENVILNMISKGLAANQKNNGIKLAAVKALTYSLELAEPNFERPKEKQLIFTMIFNASTCSDERVREAGISCLVEVASKYYDQMGPFMRQIFEITKKAICSDSEEAGKMGIEFWSTVAETEADLKWSHQEAEESGMTPPDQKSCNFTQAAISSLIPSLWSCLSKQNEDVDDEEWNLASAAGCCLTKMSEVAGDSVVKMVLPLVEGNIRNKDWRVRDAATTAFATMLNGPTKEKLIPLVQRAFPVILEHVKDSNDVVKHTAAWTIGRICEEIPEVITPKVLPHLMRTLIMAMTFSSKVASKACYAVRNLADALDQNDSDEPSNPLTKYFYDLMKSLLDASNREDADQGLMASAYECIASLIHTAGKDSYETIKKLIPHMLKRLEMSVNKSKNNSDTNNVNIQAYICGTLVVCIRKLPVSILGSFMDTFMLAFLEVLKCGTSVCHEEALLGVTEVVRKTKDKCMRYMKAFTPLLLKSLNNVLEVRVCGIAIGLAGDIVEAVGSKIKPIADNLVQHFLNLLQSADLMRDVKPRVIHAIGGMALALGKDFQRYLRHVMGMLQKMALYKFEDPDEDDIEFMNQLRESLLETYTSIFAGLSDENAQNLFRPYVDSVWQLICVVGKDEDTEDSVLISAVSLVGDIAKGFGSQATGLVSQTAIQELLHKSRRHSNSKVQERAQWAQDECQKATRH